MQKQSTYYKKVYAITEALAIFKHYLLGHSFIIQTNHESMKNLMDQIILPKSKCGCTNSWGLILKLSTNLARKMWGKIQFQNVSYMLGLNLNTSFWKKSKLH